MYGKYFTYNNRSSEDFNLMIGGVNASTAIPFAMSRQVIKGNLNRYKNQVNFMGTAWSDVLVFEISVTRDVCNDENTELVFSEDEVNEINAWLTSPDYPLLFHMYNYEDATPIVDQYDYFGVFSDVEAQEIAGEVVGFTMTFTTNSPFAWTAEKSVTQLCPSEGTTITINIDSPEEYREIYPLIEIVGVSENEFDYDPETGEYTGSASARENITITNTNDTYGNFVKDETTGRYVFNESNRELSVEVPHIPVYIDSKNARIYDVVQTSSGNVNHVLDWDDLGLSDISYIYWPRLFNGENTWTVDGSCNITITYREPRKVGAY